VRRPRRFHAFLALAILSSLLTGLITYRHLSTNAKLAVDGGQQDATVMLLLPIQTNPAKVREQERLRIEAAYRNLPLSFEPNRVNPNPRIAGEARQHGKVNDFIGRREQWRTNIHTYSRIRYHSLYPGIDLIFHGDKQELEYDLVVFPGASPGQIKLGISGAESLRLDEGGNLVL